MYSLLRANTILRDNDGILVGYDYRDSTVTVTGELVHAMEIKTRLMGKRDCIVPVM